MPDMPPAFAGLTTARPEEIGLSRAGLKRLTSVMEREIEAGRAPGVAMLVARHGKVGYAQALGALRPGGPAMTDDAIFRIYSMTKPIVTVAAMTLVEDGRMFVHDPVAKYIPAFADVKVGVETADGLDLVPLARPMTIQDLMRHTSGLTYGWGASRVEQIMRATWSRHPGKTMAENCEALAALPLQHQPGTAWEYSVSTDVLGRVVEVVAGGTLGEVLRERVFAPLAMDDTAFFIPPVKLPRQAEPMSPDKYHEIGASSKPQMEPPKSEGGGGGLVSTLGDYARFLAMLSGGGALDGARVLGSRTIAFMTSDHLGAGISKRGDLLTPGYGFGLGFAVRVDAGIAPGAGSVGEYNWGGIAGTSFWVSPRDSLFAIFMVQAPDQREYFGPLFRNLVNAAIM
jgi:CubicO group peptidase (beta-lactamase class C family)